MKFRTAYDGLADEVSYESGLECLDPSLAVQSQLEDADINTIVKRFGLTGELPANKRVPLDPDTFYDNVEYRDCLDVVAKANASFMSLPAGVRARFDNDPALFCDFAEVPENYDTLVEWGLAEKRELPSVPPAEVPPA